VKDAFTLRTDCTFEMAIEALDSGGKGFLAVIDDNHKLLGILTDGDVRRAFLVKNYALEVIINKAPEVMNELSSRQAVISKLKSLHRRHMPIVDSDGYFKHVFSLDDVEFVNRENPVVIMAGGLGSRLGELTKETPKPMLRVGNQPMLQHLVELFREQGFRKFIFCVNYKKNVIRDYFLDGTKFGVKIDYVEENTRMGTAGALSLIETQIKVPFFVINADILTNLDFTKLLDFHDHKKSLATMCVRTYKMQVPYGVVNSGEDSTLVSMVEKPDVTFNVNAGIYLLDPIVFSHIPQNKFFDMPSLFEKLLQNQVKPAVYPVDDYWLDIGRKEDLAQANLDMKDFGI
jgi:dTDP-glucose pyrophosphorylase/CBS domain-containing protein